MCRTSVYVLMGFHSCIRPVTGPRSRCRMFPPPALCLGQGLTTTLGPGRRPFRLPFPRIGFPAREPRLGGIVHCPVSLATSCSDLLRAHLFLFPTDSSSSSILRWTPPSSERYLLTLPGMVSYLLGMSLHLYFSF